MAEKQKKTEARCTVSLWTRACQEQETKAQENADAQWQKVEDQAQKVEKAEAAASELHQQNEVLTASVRGLNESFRDIETELQRQKCDNRARHEAKKFRSDKHIVTQAEYEAAREEQEEEMKKSQLLRQDLDTSRRVKNQHKEAEVAMSPIHYAEHTRWETEECHLETSLSENRRELSECKTLLSRAQDAVKIKSAINSSCSG